MNGWRNFLILGAMFSICVACAVHGAHDNDKELMAFGIDSAKQILAAILAVMTAAVSFGQRKTDTQPGGPNGGTSQK